MNIRWYLRLYPGKHLVKRVNNPFYKVFSPWAVNNFHLDCYKMAECGVGGHSALQRFITSQWLPAILTALSLTLLATACRPAAPFLPGSPLSSPPATPTAQATGSQKYPVDPLTLDGNLAQLESYRTHLMVDFDGQREGQPAQGRLSLETALDRSGDISSYTIEVEGTLPNSRNSLGRSELLQVGDKVYLKRAGEQFWFEWQPGQPSTPGALGLFEPERLVILPPTVSHPPQFERLDEVEVQHYRFTQDDLAAPNLIFDRAEGELWVTVAGRMVLRYTLSATVRLATPLPNATLFDQGTLKLDYTLTDLNADLALNPPDLSQTIASPLAALPRLPDAQVTAVFPALLEYTSAISPISATLFYQAELLDRGWTEGAATIFNEKANLNFSREGEALTIIIHPAQEPRQIKVILGLQAPP